MRYRVDDLAARCGVTVDTVRFYQSKGLLLAPEREGRVAWYSEAHLRRLSRILDLKSKGFTLRSIKRLLSGDADDADEALVEALGWPSGEAAEEGAGVPTSDRVLTAEELASRTGLSTGLIDAISHQGLLSPIDVAGRRVYTEADGHAVRAGLALMEAGIPLEELLALARAHDSAVRQTAERAVELFVAHVRSPIRANARSQEEGSERLADAFGRMLPAATALVANHFRAALYRAARRHLDDEDGDPAEGDRPGRSPERRAATEQEAS
jgi:DNA-binding transcriptional MerR regulator